MRIINSASLLVLLFACGDATLGQEGRCLSLHMITDGTTVDGPKVVTWLDKTSKRTVATQAGKFCLPSEMAGQRELDLSFELADERFYFSRIPFWTFSAAWDVDFGGKKYARLKHLPSSADKKLSCTITLREGEPELEIITSPCRVPLNAPSPQS